MRCSRAARPMTARETPVSVALQHINCGAGAPPARLRYPARPRAGHDGTPWPPLPTSAFSPRRRGGGGWRESARIREPDVLFRPGGRDFSAAESRRPRSSPSSRSIRAADLAPRRSVAGLPAPGRTVLRASRMRPRSRERLPRVGEEAPHRHRVVSAAAAAAVVLLVVLGVVLLRGSGTNDKPDTPEVEVPKLVGMKLLGGHQPRRLS